MWQKVAPGINVGNFREASSFYRFVLGVTETMGPLGEDGTYEVLRHGNVELHLQLNPAGAGHSFCFIYVDEYYRRVVEKGAPIWRELKNLVYVMRDFVAVDPWGNKIGFGRSNGSCCRRGGQVEATKVA